MYKNIPKPVLLMILDGWGVAQPSDVNAITLAKTPNFNRLVSNYPSLTLLASGEAVGLAENEPGNSEVGHMTMGIGKVFYQNLPRIDRSIKNGDFFNNQELLKAINHVKANKSGLHLIGIVSDGDVHGSLRHLFALLELARRQKVNRVFIHAILDGVDSIKDSGAGLIAEVEKKCAELGVGEIASISGRFFAMDRDGHWERTQRAFVAMANGQADEFYDNAAEAIAASYNRGIFDDGFVPVVLTSGGRPKTTIQQNDAVIFFNLKGDRAGQLAGAFVSDNFDKFERGPKMDNIAVISLVRYSEDLATIGVAYPKQVIKNSLAKIISENGFKQLHVAETEKFAHVTFFFDGGAEEPFINEDRVVMPSPMADSYARTPQMATPEISKRLEKEILREVYDFIVCNFSNMDMLGHTGDIEAAKRAAEIVDKHLGTIVDLVLSKGGVVIITADHGNAEQMKDVNTGEVTKEHTRNPVPFIIVGKEWEGKNLSGAESLGNDLSLIKPAGILADVAPTILKLLDLSATEDMEGKSLI
ncbi:MAG TPA: 2,3-bisphosphoglycerate-independent phosphoglycerate mutase [Candidatus Bipolaricaulota bacterium]|nr:2,3-bisphosphoglycerate-independent phosphoglycerate mutase [Candidatus Bipolaricaulota bacterium]